MQRKRWLLVSHLFFIFPQKNKGERFVRISLPYLFEVVYFPTAPFCFLDKVLAAYEEIDFFPLDVFVDGVAFFYRGEAALW